MAGVNAAQGEGGRNFNQPGLGRNPVSDEAKQGVEKNCCDHPLHPADKEGAAAAVRPGPVILAGNSGVHQANFSFKARSTCSGTSPVTFPLQRAAFLMLLELM